MIFFVMKTGNYTIKYTILPLNIHEKQWKLKLNVMGDEFLGYQLENDADKLYIVKHFYNSIIIFLYIFFINKFVLQQKDNNFHIDFN